MKQPIAQADSESSASTLQRPALVAALLVQGGQSRPELAAGLRALGAVVRSVETAGELEPESHRQPVDIVLLSGDSRDWITEQVTRLRECCPLAAIVVVHARACDAFGERLLDLRVFDCLPDSAPTAHISHKVMLAAEHGRLRREVMNLRQDVALRHAFDAIVGDSQPIQTMKQMLARISPTDIPVFLSGPSGSGKSLAAGVVHYHSGSRSGPFITIDCTAYNAQALHILLFGEQPYQDHVTANGPAIQAAHGGTLYLKSVAALPTTAQARLLEFLRDFQFAEHGRNRLQTVRFISSSELTPGEISERGRLRSDLLQRLSVVTVTTPPLSRCREDIPILCRYWLRRIADETGTAVAGISGESLEFLTEHPWPENVRTLAAALRRAVLAAGGETIQPQHLQLQVETTGLSIRGTGLGTGMTGARDRLLESSQQAVIHQALEDNNWNFSQTAQALGIGRTTLWRKIRKFKLTREPECTDTTSDEHRNDEEPVSAV